MCNVLKVRPWFASNVESKLERALATAGAAIFYKDCSAILVSDPTFFVLVGAIGMLLHPNPNFSASGLVQDIVRNFSKPDMESVVYKCGRTTLKFIFAVGFKHFNIIHPHSLMRIYGKGRYYGLKQNYLKGRTHGFNIARCKGKEYR